MSFGSDRLYAMLSFTLTVVAALSSLLRQGACGSPPPPDPEKIIVTRLPLPPVVSSNQVGACTDEVNPNHTGCIAQSTNLCGGGFTPDGTGVWASMNFAGAPLSPAPGHVYNGTQLVLIKADGSLFSTGDPWICVSCGVPASNGQIVQGDDLSAPQAFRDGRRVLAGNYIFECSGLSFSRGECTPDKVHIYPIYWPVNADGTGPGGSMRELRVHPDDEHIGFNSFTTTGQYAYIARLMLNEAPTTGTPRVPRYDLSHVNLLVSPNRSSPVNVDGETLTINHDAISVGELRFLGGDGTEVGYLGYPTESCNIDVYAVGLTSGSTRRLTSHPEYCDPVDISSQDRWSVVKDTRGSDRQMWLAGMRRVPPIIDLVVTAAVASVRNNGLRRFFQPFIIDRYGDRGSYSGQKVNGPRGIPGSGELNDPEWNGRADPKWSLQGNRITYWEAITLPPACGGENPLPCYTSTEPGGRDARLLLAELVERESIEPGTPEPCPDIIPWATPYTPGEDLPVLATIPPGNYTLYGKHSGYANVTIADEFSSSSSGTVAVTYHDFSDDGNDFIKGSERVASRTTESLPVIDWYSNLTQTGEVPATKMTGVGGFNLTVDVFGNIFEANGTLTTTVDGTTYLQPLNDT